LHEALVVLAIVGILATGTVGMRGIFMDHALAAQVNRLVGDLSLARSEAIKRRRAVTLCQSEGGMDCTGTNDWHRGWIIFIDENSNRSIDLDDEIIRIQPALTPGTRAVFRSSGRNRNHYLRYWPEGFSNRTGSFIFCGPPGATRPRAVILYWTGRARTSLKSAGGRPLSCPATLS